MKLGRTVTSTSGARAVATEGDFPHVRRRGVRLACCTCTTCSFTLLFGGIGALAGGIKGIFGFLDLASPPEWTAVSILGRILLFIAYLLWFGFLGLLAGAAIGFGIDYLIVLR
jgi:hypothetical protein